MDALTLLALASIGALAAGYALARLPFLTATRAQANWARAILSLTGIAFGWFAVHQAGLNASTLMQVLVFVAGWGWVHVPAAIILLLKKLQRNNF